MKIRTVMSVVLCLACYRVSQLYETLFCHMMGRLMVDGDQAAVSFLQCDTRTLSLRTGWMLCRGAKTAHKKSCPKTAIAVGRSFIPSECFCRKV